MPTILSCFPIAVLRTLELLAIFGQREFEPIYNSSFTSSKHAHNQKVNVKGKATVVEEPEDGEMRIKANQQTLILVVVVNFRYGS